MFLSEYEVYGGQLFVRRLICEPIGHLNRSQDWDYQQKYCHLRLKKIKKMIQNEGSMNMHYSSRKRKKDPKGNFRDH